MTFLLFIAANTVLAHVHRLWLLVLFRGVQSAGSAATIAIGMYFPSLFFPLSFVMGCLLTNFFFYILGEIIDFLPV